MVPINEQNVKVVLVSQGEIISQNGYEKQSVDGGRVGPRRGPSGRNTGGGAGTDRAAAGALG